MAVALSRHAEDVGNSPKGLESHRISRHRSLADVSQPCDQAKLVAQHWLKPIALVESSRVLVKRVDNEQRSRHVLVPQHRLPHNICQQHLTQSAARSVLIGLIDRQSSKQDGAYGMLWESFAGLRRELLVDDRVTYEGVIAQWTSSPVDLVIDEDEDSC